MAVVSPAGALLRMLGTGPGPDRLRDAGQLALGSGDTVYIPHKLRCRVDVYRAGPHPLRSFGHCGKGPGSLDIPIAGGYLGDLGEGLSQRRTQPLHVFGQ